MLEKKIKEFYWKSKTGDFSEKLLNLVSTPYMGKSQRLRSSIIIYVIKIVLHVDVYCIVISNM